MKYICLLKKRPMIKLVVKYALLIMKMLHILLVIS